MDFITFLYMSIGFGLVLVCANYIRSWIQYPYRWSCEREDCSFTIRTNVPNVVAQVSYDHMVKFHTTRKDSY